MRGKLLDILAWAAANGVKAVNVTDDEGNTTTITLGEPVRAERPNLAIKIPPVVEA